MRLMQFRTQRVAFTFVIFAIAFAFTTSILWNHLEKVVKDPSYQLLAKAGLLLLPIVALTMAIWELFVDKSSNEHRRLFPLHPLVRRLINWCFWGSVILMAAEIIHAGALLKYESSTIAQQNTIAAMGDAQAKIAREASAGAIQAAGEQAQKLNAAGQHRTARTVVDSGKNAAATATATASGQLSKTSIKPPDTFLPAWYIGGGMYVALPLLAILFYVITQALARQAAPFVDANDDGIPDQEQKGLEPQSPSQFPSPTAIQAKGREMIRGPQGQAAEVRRDLTEQQAQRLASQTGRNIAIPSPEDDDDDFEPQQKTRLRWRGGRVVSHPAAKRSH